MYAVGPAPARRRLSFKERHALATLPGRIEALQSEIGALRTTLADQGLYGRDPSAFQHAAARLEASESELAAAEEEWLALELRREEFEGG